MAEQSVQELADQIKVTELPRPTADLLNMIEIIPQVAPRPLEIKIGDEIDLGIRVFNKDGQPEAINTDKEIMETKQTVAALLAVISASMLVEESGVDLGETLRKFGLLPTPITLELEEGNVLKINSGDLVMELTQEDISRANKPDIEIKPEELPQPPQQIAITEDEIHQAVANGVLPAGNLREGFERALTRLANLGQGPKTLEDIFKPR